MEEIMYLSDTLTREEKREIIEKVYKLRKRNNINIDYNIADNYI